MTAEIVVMNREAVALAADSAVTSQVGVTPKISSSANKLFALSTHHPVGIMVYGNAFFMGVPWETIVKVYRSTSLPSSGFDTLEEYANDFISFLCYDNIRSTPYAEENYIVDFVQVLLSRVRREISQKILGSIDEGKDFDESLVNNVAEEVVSRHYRKYRELKSVLPLEQSRAVLRKHNSTIKNIIDNQLGDFNLSTELRRTLRRSMPYALAREFMDDLYAGVVIAGFGQREFLPTVKAYKVEGIITFRQHGEQNEVLKYQTDDDSSLAGTEVMAGVIPFAQSEMVHRFMEGVDPNYLQAEEQYLSDLFSKYAEQVVDQLSRYSDSEKGPIRAELFRYGNQLVQEFVDNMVSFREEYFSDPTVNSVSRLSKDELAAMAEALVYLTSLKRKVSQEPETVAEPIDVAVISKGDGFIWIKRKHYFRADLNPSFFLKRYKEVRNERES